MRLYSSRFGCSGVHLGQPRSISTALLYLMLSRRQVIVIPIIIIFIIYLLSFKDNHSRPPYQHETDSSELRHAQTSVAQREICHQGITLTSRTVNRGDQIVQQPPIVTTRTHAALTPVDKRVSIGRELVQSPIKPSRLQDAIARPVSNFPHAHPFASMLRSRFDHLLRFHTCDVMHACLVNFGYGIKHKRLSN